MKQFNQWLLEGVGRFLPDDLESKLRALAPKIVEAMAGLLHGLEAVHELTGGKCILNIKGDSQLVIYQLTGKYQVKKDTLKPYHAKCHAILKDIDVWQATWVRREFNEYADKLGEKHYKEINK